MITSSTDNNMKVETFSGGHLEFLETQNGGLISLVRPKIFICHLHTPYFDCVLRIRSTSTCSAAAAVGKFRMKHP
jgi:hypothetical protein